jgi:lipoprotein-anchoring transpeptidase ErfK/SrfK
MKPSSSTISRRALLSGFASFIPLALAACSTSKPIAFSAGNEPVPSKEFPPEVREMYRALPDERFPVPAVALDELDPRFVRKVIAYPTPEKPGTVIVDTAARYLYHVNDNGTAVRYGVGIGAAGFEWSGRAHIAYKREWPTWTPPGDMIRRQPELERWRKGMPPGIDNPLGARSLYIHQGNRDTLYRIHGTGEAHSIGKAVSSGCVRLLHQDVIHLHQRVRPGSALLVIPEALV